MKMFRIKQGITLIALVITIVILVILAGIAISSLTGDNGLFKRAQQAREETKLAEQEEGDTLSATEDLVDRYANGNKWLSTVTGNETTNTTVYDKYGNKVVVPAGFKIVNPEDDVTKGIIIEDVSAQGATEHTRGSQFVWVPVGDIIIDETGNTTNLTLGRYKFNSDGTSSVYDGTYTENSSKIDGGNEVAKNIDDFISKVNISHGFYIGRYEAGDAYAIEAIHEDSGITNPITCKKGVYPYIYNSRTGIKFMQKYV